MYTNLALFFSSVLFLFGSFKEIIMHNDYNTGIEYQLISFALVIILRIRMHKDIKANKSKEVLNKYYKNKVTVDELYGRENEDKKS